MTPLAPQLTLSPEEQERMTTVDRYMIEGAVQSLVDMLTDPSWAVRRAVVRSLAAIGDEAVAALCELVGERRDDEARLAAAVDALVASTGDPHDRVVALAYDRTPAVVADAAQILGRRRDPRAVPTLVQLVRHPDDNVAVAAVEALGRVGGRAAVESLVALVAGGNFFRAFPAIDVLGRSGDPRAVEPLTALLDVPTYAPEAARALGRTGERAAVAPLASLLARPVHASVRVAAVALVELRDRYRERFGATAPVDEALRHAVDPAQATRRLTQSLAGADPAEQAAIARVMGLLRDDAAVTALLTLLDRPPVVAAAASALKEMGSGDDTELIRDLAAADSARRLALLPLVTRAAAADAVVVCLEDPDAAVRAAACEALARLGNPRLVPVLFRYLADGNARVSQAAVAAIQSLGSRDTERLALAAARSTDANVRRAGLRILAYFGYSAALPLFLEAIAGGDARAREIAVQGLPFVDDPRAMEELLRAARGDDERLRAAAMRALGQCKSGDPRVTSALLRGVGDRAPWVRYYACQSLGRLGVEAAASAIAARITDDAGQVRVAAIEALSHLRAELAFAALRDAARADDPDLRRAALVGLGLSHRAEAEPILLAACADPDAATRLVAASAIADFDAPEALAAIARAAADPDDSVRTAAVGFLSARDDRAAAEALIALLPATPERDRVLTALAVPSEPRIAAIVAALAAADDELAAHLVSALVRMHRADANAALMQAFTLPSARARKAVASGLYALATPEAFAILQRAATRDVDAEVRRIAALLLAQH